MNFVLLKIRHLKHCATFQIGLESGGEIVKNRDKTESKGDIKRKHIYTLCTEIRVTVIIQVAR